jgi:peptidoglycan/xylan/chitin deacetylase (PgdA/CDA1 family)
LTLDDGFKDHHRYVFPELKRRGLWGISYVPTSPLATGRLLDVHRIHMLLGRHGGKAICDSIRQTVSDDMLSHAHIAEFRSETYRRQNNDDYTNYAKRLLNYYIDYRHRQEMIDNLMGVYFPDESHLVTELYMTRDEILELHNAGMIIGSHTVNHFVMSKLNLADQDTEIRASFSFLEGIVGEIEVKTFCYPYGGFHTFTPETEKLLADNGCLFSFNVEARDIEQRDLSERRQALPRYDCNQFPYGQCRDIGGAAAAL